MYQLLFCSFLVFGMTVSCVKVTGLLFKVFVLSIIHFIELVANQSFFTSSSDLATHWRADVRHAWSVSTGCYGINFQSWVHHCASLWKAGWCLCERWNQYGRLWGSCSKVQLCQVPVINKRVVVCCLFYLVSYVLWLHLTNAVCCLQ